MEKPIDPEKSQEIKIAVKQISEFMNNSLELKSQQSSQSTFAASLHKLSMSRS